MNKLPTILVKTQLDMEKIVAARIMEILPNIKAEPKPYGFRGIVVVYSEDPINDAERIKHNVIEAERVIPALKVVGTDLDEIVDAVKKIIKNNLGNTETFAVRTVRRGKQQYSSVDVNIKVGAVIKEITGADVDLSFPDKIIAIEIVGKYTLISILPGNEEYKKMRPDKKPILKYLHKLALIQIPYLGPIDAAYTMGIRVGRAAQNFELKEIIISPYGLTPANQLNKFIEGVYEGIHTRYETQRKIYSRPVRKVEVFVEDLYQVVRDRFDEPLIVFEPEGDPVIKMKHKIKDIFEKQKRINIFVGSRSGIPIGIYRYSTLILDLAPEITISTDFAASSAVVALITVLEEQ